MRWPRMHIAASVQNRIMNAADNIAPAISTSLPPDVPQPQEMGKALDQALSTPPVAAAAPADSEEAIAAGAIQGESAADAVGGLAAIEALA